AKKDVEGERDQNRERDGHQQCRHERYPRDHPRLLEELAELERPPESRLERVPRHFEEAAHGPSRNRELILHSAPFSAMRVSGEARKLAGPVPFPPRNRT